VVREDAVARQLAVLQATLARASLHLDKLRAEWLDTKLFSFNAAEVVQALESLPVLQLGIMHDKKSCGIEDLRLVLSKLTSVGSCLTNLDSLVIKRVIAWNSFDQFDAAEVCGWGANRTEASEHTKHGTYRPFQHFIRIRRVLDKDYYKTAKEKVERVNLFGWLANIMTDEGWGGYSKESRNMLKKVIEWLMKDYGDVEGGREYNVPP
jgi:hypothetical protein